MTRAELYRLTFPSGKIYVGMTTRGTGARFDRHVYEASRGRRSPLADAIRKHGAASVSIETLAVGDREYILGCEIRAISVLGADDPARGYNILPGGQMAPTILPEVAARVSASMMGNQNCVGFKHSAETRAKLSASKMDNKGPLGRKQTEEHKRKRAVGYKAWLLTEAGQAYLSRRPQGRNPSSETKAKISLALRSRREQES